MYKVKYKGKRVPLTLNLIYLDNVYKWTTRESIVEMTDKDAKLLLERNPKGYEVVEHVKDKPQVVDETIMDIGETAEVELGGEAETVIEVAQTKGLHQMNRDELEVFAKEELGKSVDKRWSKSTAYKAVKEWKKEAEIEAAKQENLDAVS